MEYIVPRKVVPMIPTDDDGEEHPAWTRLQEMYARGDFEKLDRVVEMLDSLETFGKAGNMIRRFIVMCGKVLLWTGMMLAAVSAIQGEWPKFVSRLFGGSPQ